MRYPIYVELGEFSAKSDSSCGRELGGCSEKGQLLLVGGCSKIAWKRLSFYGKLWYTIYSLFVAESLRQLHSMFDRRKVWKPPSGWKWH
jgi:hypothetical protein